MCWSLFFSMLAVILVSDLCCFLFCFSLGFLVEFIVLCCLFDVSLLLLLLLLLFVCLLSVSFFVFVVWWGVVTLLCYQRVLDPESIELLQNPADTTLMRYDYTDRRRVGTWRVSTRGHCFSSGRESPRLSVWLCDSEWQINALFARYPAC